MEVTDWAKVVVVLHAGIYYGGPPSFVNGDDVLPGYHRYVDRFSREGLVLWLRRNAMMGWKTTRG